MAIEDWLLGGAGGGVFLGSVTKVYTVLNGQIKAERDRADKAELRLTEERDRADKAEAAENIERAKRIAAENDAAEMRGRVTRLEAQFDVLNSQLAAIRGLPPPPSISVSPLPAPPTGGTP